VSTKRTAIAIGVLLVVAVAALAGYGVMNFWLPGRVGRAITERFGEYITVGTVRYVFPMGVEVRDVEFVRRPGWMFSGKAEKVKVKLRPSAVLLLRFDGRLLEEVTTDEYTIYVYPPRVPRPPLPGLEGASAEDLFKLPGIVPPTGGAEGAVNALAAPRPERAGGGDDGNAAAPEPGARRSTPEEFDFTFRADRGKVVLRREKTDTVILREVYFGGDVSDQALDVTLRGKTTRERSFEIAAEHSFVTKVGKADYKVEAVEAIHVLPLARKPDYLLEAEGVLTLDGTLSWRGGKLDHRATGRLKDGRLVIAPDSVRIMLDDVDFGFTLHNADLSIDEGSCRAAEARWRFGGRTTDFFVDVTFRSENMTLQNLVNMFAGEVRLGYAGVGVAELHIGGTPREPEFYVHVERTDK
jgi:hypothetical protein